MRPLTFGVLCSVGPPPRQSTGFGPGALGAGPGLDPSTAEADGALEAAVDLRAASDLCQALHAMGHRARPVPADDDLDLTLRQSEIDACLLALHGRQGGGGDIQALLTVRGVPFAGQSGQATALSFDKVRGRQLLAYHNLPVPASIALGPSQRTSDRALEMLGWPCFVKPRRGALGMGVSAILDPAHVSEALGRALQVDREVVLERAMAGTEVQVVLLGERVLGAVEVSERDAFGAEITEMICPPRLTRSRLDGICTLARRAVSALGLHEGISRVDLIVNDRHNEVILEVEPLPPLHGDGVVARVARAAGFSYEAIVAELADRIMLRVPQSRPADEPRLMQ